MKLRAAMLLMATVMFLAAATPAVADPVTVNFAGTVTGTFGGPYVSGINYTDGAFNTVASYNNPGQVSPLAGTGSLGSISLDPSWAFVGYLGTLTLDIQFTIPQELGLESATSLKFSGRMRKDVGSLYIQWDQPTLKLQLADGDSAWFYVNPMTVTGPSPVSITGYFVTTPEPASLALLGTGLIGTGSLLRRRFGVKKS